MDCRNLAILVNTYHHCTIIAIDNKHNERSAANAVKHGAHGYLVHTTASKDAIYDSVTTTHQQSKLSRQQLNVSRYDDLTGLANEFTLLNTLTNAFEHTNFEQISMAVLSIAIHNKPQLEVNEKALLPRLLPAISQRLTHNLRDTDRVARMNNGDFSILLQHLNADSDAAIVAEKLIELLQAPYHLGVHTITIAINIGIALPSNRHSHARDLINDADNALVSARNLGPNYFTQHTLRSRPAESLHLRSRLCEAISQDQFRLVYQPQVNIKNGKVIAVEALLRWQLEPDRILSPAQFMHHIEQSRHCSKVTHWVIDKVCQQIGEWQKKGYEQLPISVNLCHKQFIDPALVNTLENALLKHGSNAKQLRLEVSESTLRQDVKRSKETIQQLTQLGIQISIDDFGTGTRTLDTLHNFNVGQVKIDSSLVGSVLDTPAAMEMVDSLILTCHHLGIDIAAEAVETRAQLDYLKRKDCDSYQGFLFSKPIAADDLPSLLTSA